MPHIVRFALPEARIITSDLCDTPVVAGYQIFAGDTKMQFEQADVFNMPPELQKTLKGKTSAIVTDTFMTRFPPEDPEGQRALYIHWKNLLKPGGMVLTSIRQPSPEEINPGMQFEHNSQYTSNYVTKSVQNYQNGIQQKGILEPPIPIAVVRTLAEQYLAHMGSSHAKSYADQLASDLYGYPPGNHDIKVRLQGGVDTIGLPYTPGKSTLEGAGYGLVEITVTNRLSLDITPRHYNLVKAVK